MGKRFAALHRAPEFFYLANPQITDTILPFLAVTINLFLKETCPAVFFLDLLCNKLREADSKRFIVQSILAKTMAYCPQ